MILQEYSFRFYDDLYLYDLNMPESPPLAWRAWDGGTQPPDLPELLGMRMREWLTRAEGIYQSPVALAGERCAVLIHISSRAGRFGVVVVPHLPREVFVRMAGEGSLGALDGIAGRSRAHGTPAAEQGFAETVQRVRLLIDSCAQISDAEDLDTCISMAAELWGVHLLPRESAEFAPLQASGSLPEPVLEPGALVISLAVMASLLRNAAHGRSGWMYAQPSEHGPVLQCAMRTDAEQIPDVLLHLQVRMEEGGVIVGRRDGVAPYKPPKQYSYMHSKIGDSARPLCNLCGCYDAHCVCCTALRWAVLPYVTDQALLGIKNYIVFEQ